MPKIDWITVIIYVLLAGIGIINIYSASHQQILDVSFFSTFSGKQFIFFCISILLGAFMWVLNPKIYESLSQLFYIVGLISLIGVLLVGKKISGASSWYTIGSFTLQPSEFSKITTSLLLASFINSVSINLSRSLDQIKALLIIGIPAFFVAMQPDMGTVIVFCALVFLLFREGLPIWYLVIIFLGGVSFTLTLKFGVTIILITTGVILLILLYKKKRNLIELFAFAGIISISSLSTSYIYNYIFKPHHQNRFKLWLNLEENSKRAVRLKQTIGYNTYQAESAISSGKFFGKGFMEGSLTQGEFIPEQHTDYIFSVLGEEFGFLGTSIVIILFTLLIFRIIFLAEKQKNYFSCVYGYCVAIILFTHYLINIGMVMGLIPTIGIPLPYFSYGGSSFIAFSLMLFIFLKLNSNKAEEWESSIRKGK